MLDSIYHIMALNSILSHIFGVKTLDFFIMYATLLGTSLTLLNM